MESSFAHTYNQEGSTCSTCFRGLLSLQYGVLVCDACGETVAFLEETQEIPFYGSGVGGTQRLREQSQAARGGISTHQDIRRVDERQRTVGLEEVGQSVDEYVGLLYALLMDGARRVEDVLLSGCGRGGCVRVVEDIWWRWVAVSGVLVEEGLEGWGQIVEEVNRSTSDRDERHVVFERFLAMHLPFHRIYAIFLIACIIERHPIDAYDVTTLFVSTGAVRVTDQSVVEASLASREYLCSDGVPNPIRVYLDAKELVEMLGIVLPPLNVHGWLARYEGSEGAQVMAGLYCAGRMRLESNDNLLPWSVLASARGFLGESLVVSRGAKDLLLPRDANYVPQRIGQARLQEYAKWFVERVGQEDGDNSFDFVLDKVESAVMGLTRDTPAREAEKDTVITTVSRTLPWCYVPGVDFDLDRTMLDNELEVRLGMDRTEKAAREQWLEFVSGYETKRDAVRRRVVELTGNGIATGTRTGSEGG